MLKYNVCSYGGYICHAWHIFSCTPLSQLFEIFNYYFIPLYLPTGFHTGSEWTLQTPWGELIPITWYRTGGILIPKERDSAKIYQFHQISLLNIESKIFFIVVPLRLSAHMEKNHFIDKTLQKVWTPCFSLCFASSSLSNIELDGKGFWIYQSPVFLGSTSAP